MGKLRAFAIGTCFLAALFGLFGLSVLPPVPCLDAAGKLDPAGVAYLSMFMLVVAGSLYGLIICAPKN